MVKPNKRVVVFLSVLGIVNGSLPLMMKMRSLQKIVKVQYFVIPLDW